MKDQLTCFKKYDIRGQIGINLDEEICYRIARAFATVLKTKKVVVGQDVRETSSLYAESVIKALIDEGVVGALATLCRIADPKAVKMSSACFSQLSVVPEGKMKITEKTSTVVALFNMIDSDDIDTQIAVAHTTCNLLMYEYFYFLDGISILAL